MNQNNSRIDTAHRVFIACGGDIDESMKHENMPYKAKKTLRKLARENKWYQEIGITEPWRMGLKEEDIEDIHETFIKTGGHIRNTAQRTGFGRSTVSKYAKARGWYRGLEQVSVKSMNRESAQKQNKEDEGVMRQLRTLRKALFNEIIGNEYSKTIDKASLKIAPKTLSAAIKALLDIDKRVSERAKSESCQQREMPVAYQNILVRCMRIVNDESEI